VVVHGANVQDRDGARLILPKWVGRFKRLTLIWADGGYAGELIAWTWNLGQWLLTIIKRNDNVKGFEVLPKRWIVERTFAWFGGYRRLSKDYETCVENSEAMIKIAMINLMLHRLKPG
jgi:putative transposase